MRNKSLSLMLLIVLIALAEPNFAAALPPEVTHFPPQRERPLAFAAAIIVAIGVMPWASDWAERTRAAGGAGGPGHLLAAGEHVPGVQPKLGARVRLPAAGKTNKNVRLCRRYERP